MLNSSSYIARTVNIRCTSLGDWHFHEVASSEMHGALVAPNVRGHRRQREIPSGGAKGIRRKDSIWASTISTIEVTSLNADSAGGGILGPSESC